MIAGNVDTDDAAGVAFVAGCKIALRVRIADLKQQQ